ncbi:MAG: DUF4838 domain-containing protein [Clostridia bacterium]|nr:DUF4838 domain-containing protein [Clostridia bacterium]
MSAYPVIEFARAELDRYLGRLGVQAEISLGLFSDFDLPVNVEEPYFDDAIAISVKNKQGYIAGTNERSVLIGVYRLLSEWGIRWVRPGKNGTRYPAACTAPDVELTETAAKRHRIMCIEGAVSLENVLDMIEWLPKVGMNGYYIQFVDAFIFFDRWYSHRGNPLRKAEPFSPEVAKEYVEIMTREIKRRGMLLHRMGHGWHSDPFGIICHDWDPVDPATIPQSYLDICAMRDGKRGLCRNMPAFTQLCYSNPYVRRTMVNAVLTYAKEHPETDVVHFWLADYFNNTCECENCTKYRFSDYYIDMVNDVAEELHKEGRKTQIVFSCGCNQAHPPVHAKLKHPENTMLMFAPISRTFAEPFPAGYPIKETPPYRVNGYDTPRSVEENLAYLYGWKQYYPGDVVDFDYHLMWDHIFDAGGEGIARVLHEDARNFDALGINSFISCQLQRNSFPTAIAMHAMAKTLWDRNADFDAIRRELYEASFGEEMAEEMGDYFATLSRGFSIGAIRSQIKVDRAQFRTEMAEAVAAIERMTPTIEAHAASESDPCRRECWELLVHHGKIYGLLGRAIIAFLDGKREEYDRLLGESVRVAWECEDEVQGSLDCMFYGDMMYDHLNLDGPKAFDDF